MKINQMTATYSKGDAIGNYVTTLDRIFKSHGFSSNIYSDNTSIKNFHSSKYKPTGENALWFHYSIFSPNLKYLKESDDIKILDFHGVSPAYLFKGYNNELECLCDKGNALLGDFKRDVDLCVVHSEYSRSVLEESGYENIIKLPLVVDLYRLSRIKENKELAQLLKKIKYILFVGRIVPQKSIIATVKAFYYFKKLNKDFKLFLVGDYNIAREYTSEVNRLVSELGLDNDVILTGKLDDSQLITFYKCASLFIILSEWETFCVPLIESMYFHVPIIASDNTAIPEILGNAGVPVDNKNPSQIAEEIDLLLSNENRYKLLQHNCSLRINNFTEAELDSQLIHILDNLRKVLA